MAGEWIKMRTNLDSDPRVIEIACQLETSELHVVGMLWKVWSWADEHTLDGNALRVTSVTLDRFTGVSGFAEALRNVGWLEGRDNALSFPRFAEHNGQTAKKRAETNKRVAKHRNANSVTNVTPKALPEREKRREEKSITHSHPQGCENFLSSPEFATVWDEWGRHLLALNKPMSPSSSQAQIYQMHGMSVEDAIAAVRFSISRNAKNLILNGDHKRERSQSSGGYSKRKTPGMESII